jgi:flagellar protein FlaG
MEVFEMEIEAISKVGGNMGTSEPAARTAPAVETTPVEPLKEVGKAVEPVQQSDKKGDAQTKGKKEHQPSEATINDAVSSANRRMERTRCEYSYHEETNRISIKVLDADTDEVIREIPPEKSLDMLQKMWEMAGILVDEKR